MPLTWIQYHGEVGNAAAHRRVGPIRGIAQSARRQIMLILCLGVSEPSQMGEDVTATALGVEGQNVRIAT
jgi:hypothetical protein